MKSMIHPTIILDYYGDDVKLFLSNAEMIEDGRPVLVVWLCC